MNLVTDLENELVFALLVENKRPEDINPENALVLIDNIKAALEPDSTGKKEAETNSANGKTTKTFSH